MSNTWEVFFPPGCSDNNTSVNLPCEQTQGRVFECREKGKNLHSDKIAAEVKRRV